MNSKISPNGLKEITLANTFLSSLLDLDKERITIELDRRLLIKTQLLKIKDVSNPSKKEFCKKKIYFTVFTDILILSKIPKKGLLQNKEAEPVHTYLDGGIAKVLSSSEAEFTFLMNGDTFVVGDDKELCSKLVVILKNHSRF